MYKALIIYLFFCIYSFIHSASSEGNNPVIESIAEFMPPGMKQAVELTAGVLPYRQDGEQFLKDLSLKRDQAQAEIENHTKEMNKRFGVLDEEKTKYERLIQELVGPLGLESKEAQELLHKIPPYMAEEKKYLSEKLALDKERKAIYDEWINAHSIRERETLEDRFASKSSYDITDLQKAQYDLAAVEEHITALASRRESLQKQEQTEQGKLNPLPKEIEALDRELEKPYMPSIKKRPEQLEGGERDWKELAEDASVKLFDLRSKRAALKAKQLYIESKIKKSRIERSFIENELKNCSAKRDFLERAVRAINSKLTVEVRDVRAAETKYNQERTIKEAEVRAVTQEIEDLRTRRENVIKNKKIFSEQIEQLKTAGDEKQADYIIAELQVLKCSTNLALLNAQISARETYLVGAQINPDMAECSYEYISVKFELKTSYKKEAVETRLSTLRSKKAMLEGDIKVMNNQRDEAVSSLAQVTSTLNNIQKKMEDVQSQKETVFIKSSSHYTQAVSLLKEAHRLASSHLAVLQKHLATIAGILPRQETLLNQYKQIIRELETNLLEFDIWSRSPKAISFPAFVQAVHDGEEFLKRMFWATPFHLNPIFIIKTCFSNSLFDWLTFSFLFLACTLFILLFHFIVTFVDQRAESLFAEEQNKLRYYYGGLLKGGMQFLKENFFRVFLLLFGYFYAWWCLSGIQYPFFVIKTPYYLALFYLISIPALLYLSYLLVAKMRVINEQLSFFFFNQQDQEKYFLLLSVALYSTVFLLPLRNSFISYVKVDSDFPAVILGAYSLILVVVLLFFFTKEDVLRMLPSEHFILAFIKRGIEAYYYPVFFFLMGLLILANPYVGYFHLAWYLSFAVPVSLLVISGLLLLHYYLRRYSVFLFLIEDEEEVTDKFEHAKMYYGFLVVFSFILFALADFVILSHIWRVPYTLEATWKALSEDFVITLGTGTKIGVLQLAAFLCFVIGGFVISSLANKYLLNKLFDVFRTEPGAQNTIGRISHYLIISMATLLGLAEINLSYMIPVISLVLVGGIGIGLRDQLSDFFAGLLVLLERQVEIGHFIETGGIMGTVQRISVRSTTIRTALNHSVIIPNRVLISNPISNWGHGRYAIAFDITVQVMDVIDVELVRNLLLEIAYGHPLVLRVPSVVVRLENFTEAGGYVFLIRPFISSRKVREVWNVASDIRVKILKVFSQHSIRLLVPRRIIISGTSNDKFPTPAEQQQPIQQQP